MVVPSKKVSDNFSMAEPVHRIFQQWAGPKGSKTKWIAGTAAVIALARLSDDEIQQLLRDVAIADVTDEYEQLLARPKPTAPLRLPNMNADGKRLVRKKKAAKKKPKST